MRFKVIVFRQHLEGAFGLVVYLFPVTLLPAKIVILFAVDVTKVKCI